MEIENKHWFERMADEIAALGIVAAGISIIIYSMVTPGEMPLNETVIAGMLLIEPGLAYLFGKSAPNKG